jgi:hypothetical protein
MTPTLLVLFTTLAAVLVRAVLAKMNSLPPQSCARCGLPRERRQLGERICACS